MRSNEPPSRSPRIVPGGRVDARPGTRPVDRGREGTLRAFLRPTIWTLVASVGLVVFTGYVTLRVVRSRDAPPPPDPGAFQALDASPLGASAPPPRGPGATAAAPAGPLTFPAGTQFGDSARAALAVVDETERGREGGAWSVARKRFEPCPGEDVERLAWIDPWSRIVKLTGLRTAPAVTVEQWFDREGHLRGVRASSATAPSFSLSALLDERGEVVQRASTGAAPPLDELRLTREDPSSAFFEKPRCEPAPR